MATTARRGSIHVFAALIYCIAGATQDMAGWRRVF